MTTRGILALFIVLAILGWVGLASFTYYNPPLSWNRWVAMAMLWPTLFATFMAPVYWLHRHRDEHGDIVPRAARQSALAALFFTLCVWLRMVQALNWANGILLLLLVVVAEALLAPRGIRNEK